MTFARLRIWLLCGLVFVNLQCSSQQPMGKLSVVAQNLTASGQVARMTATINPGGLQQDLQVSSTDPTKFTGSVVVAVGAYSVTVDAFNSSGTKVGTGSTSATVTKGVVLQAQISVLDLTGPAPGPDHSPIVTSLVTPSPAQVGDSPVVSGTAIDPDGDSITYAWTASPTGCGTFGNASAASTTFTAVLPGTCTLTFTASANGKSDSRSAQIQIVQATGTIDISVTYVPFPVISSISFSSAGTVIATVGRNGDGTIHTPSFHKGTTYTVTLTFDPWPTGTPSLSDNCSGIITQPTFIPSGSTATGTWTPTSSSGLCQVTASLQRETLTDTFFVVTLLAP